MMKMSMSQLRQAIQERGESPPQNWGKIELRDRLTELMNEAGESTTTKTNLREWVSQLNRASRKKQELITFCSDRLKIALTGHETIPVLQQKAMKVIYSVSIPSALDTVGFGKFASKTYGQILHEETKYSQWVQETYLEGGQSCEIRLQRLATWLIEQTDRISEAEEETPHKITDTITPKVTDKNAWETDVFLKKDNGKGRGKPFLAHKDAGYRKAADNGAASSASASSDKEDLKVMKETVAALKAELNSLRGIMSPSDLPRKKNNEAEGSKGADTEATETDQSFQMDVVGTRPLTAGAARCHGKYEHGLCEGAMAGKSACYTPEFTKLVVSGLQQELSFYGVQQEGQGISQTPDLFGGGETCVCDATCQSGHVQTCSCCVLGREHVPVLHESFVSEQKEEDESERQAREHVSRGELSFKHMDQFLSTLDLNLPRKGRGMLGGTNTRPAYFQFGAYSYGKFSGKSHRTQEHPKLCHYINAFLKHHLGNEATWSSFVISIDNRLPLHRDIHNKKGSRNYTCGFGDYTGGELWLAGQDHEEGKTGYKENTRILRHWNPFHPSGILFQRIQTAAFRVSVSSVLSRGSQTIETYCDKHSIYLDLVPAEAHWQVGTVEQAVQGLKQLMDKLHEEDSEISSEEALATAVRTFNHREQIRGFSPGQLALGRNGDESDRFVPTANGLPPDLLVENASGEFERDVQRRAIAERDKRAPWTFTKVAEEIGGNQYEDISREAPDDIEWNRAQDPTQEAPPTRHRITHKRPPPQAQPGDDDAMGEAASAARPRLQENQQQASFADHGWWNQVPHESWNQEPVEFWMHSDTAVEVEVEVPQSNRGLKQMCQNFEGFFVGALKRKAVEVCERKLSPEDRAKFQEAKTTEVKNFIAAKAFQALPSHLQPSASQAVGMRWILTWKNKEDGSRKAKARAVLLGYQDPSYEHRSTTSPVMTRQTRQMFLQYAAWKKWTMKKGDVSGAFLQGREYPDLLHCIPCPEILAEMGLPPGSVTQLKRACYGLVDAPLEWYRSVDSFLKELGFVRSWSDPCAWLWRVQGTLRGAISGHVDDFLFMGDDNDKEWQEILRKIQEKFRWGDWESGSFVQCGVKVTQTKQGFELSQPDYTRDIKEIPLNASRRKEDDSPINVAPHFSAEVSLLLSETTEGTVQTVKKANSLLRQAHLRQDHKMLIHGFTPDTPLGIYAWVDAANQNRVKGGSTQGIFIGFAPLALAAGEVTEISPVSWHSSHLDRTCRSPGSAEVQAAVNGEDSLYFARYQWSEMLHGEVDVRQPNDAVSRVPGYLITDSRNVYDKLTTEVLVIKGAEKKSNIELLSVKEAQMSTGIHVRWVHSEAQLANGLTKSGPSREFELFYQMQGRWRIVEDPSMMSARRRKQAGLQPLEAASVDASMNSWCTRLEGTPSIILPQAMALKQTIQDLSFENTLSAKMLAVVGSKVMATTVAAAAAENPLKRKEESKLQTLLKLENFIMVTGWSVLQKGPAFCSL
ncbi:RE1 [Symbiodinium sp. CCMP2592]|nr:RE1 [Symbiodinium sp. CCMP2592]